MSLLFVYGTLRCEEVVDTILGAGSFKNILKGQASLPKSEAFYVVGEDYPALTDSPSNETLGLLLDVTEEELEKIYKYEDPEDYDLFELETQREGEGPVKALVFWPKAPLREQLDHSKPWSYDLWRERVHLGSYLEKVRLWAQS